MADTYEILGVYIEARSAGTPSIATLTVRATDGLTGQQAPFSRTLQNLTVPQQAQVDGIITNAILYVQTKIPGITVTLPLAGS